MVLKERASFLTFAFHEPAMDISWQNYPRQMENPIIPIDQWISQLSSKECLFAVDSVRDPQVAEVQKISDFNSQPQTE